MICWLNMVMRQFMTSRLVGSSGCKISIRTYKNIGQKNVKVIPCII